MAERIFFRSLARPHGPLEPLRTMQPGGAGPLWRGAANAYVADGRLRRREGLVDSDEPMSDLPNSVLTSFEAGVDASYYEQAPVLIADVDNDEMSGRVVVTTAELLLWRLGTWYNMTPVYDAGTVTVNNGSTSVSGSGTSWLDRGIDEPNAILLQGSYYPIASVSANGSLTLARAYQGSNLSGASYEIRRRFGTNYEPYEVAHSRSIIQHAFVQVFNGELYICGPFGLKQDTVILKISDFFKTGTPAPADVQYVFGGAKEYAISTDHSPSSEAALDYIGARFTAQGMQILQDGRIVIAGAEWSSYPAGPRYSARVRFSSHLNNGVWTVAPAGAVDIVTREGSITALGNIGETLTVHHNDGIVLGELTGNDLYPLQWRDSRAEYGTVSPAALVNINGVEIYPARDFSLRVFRGTTAEVFDHSYRAWIRSTGANSSFLYSAHAFYVDHRDEYRLFLPHAPSNKAGEETNGFTLAYYTQGEGRGWPQRFECAITAAVRSPIFDMTAGSASNYDQGRGPTSAASYSYGGIAVVGAPLYGFAKESKVWLLALRTEGNDADLPVYYGTPGTPGDMSLTLEDMDFDAPEFRKIIDTVHVAFAPIPDPGLSATNTVLTITVWYDDGADDSQDVTLPAGESGLATAHFDQNSGMVAHVALATASTSFVGHDLVSMVVVADIVGAEEAS